MQFVEVESAARCRLITYRITPEGESEGCLISFLEKVKPPTADLLELNLQVHASIKTNIFMEVTYKKPLKDDPDEFEYCVGNLKTKNVPVFQTTSLSDVLDAKWTKLKTEKSECELKGSGWIFSHVNWLELRINKYKPLGGCSYIELPATLSNKKALINVHNEDQFCFQYSVWTPRLTKKEKPQRVSSYIKDPAFAKGYVWDCVDYPVKLRDIPKFEKVNNISINVFGVDDNDNVYPIKVCQEELPNHCDLLFLSDGEKEHYVYIKNLEKLIGRQVTSRRSKINICKNCFTTFDTRYNGVQKLKEHKALCMKNKSLRIVMPEDQELAFKNHGHSQRVSFTIYADLECILKPIQGPQQRSDVSYTTPYQQHEAIAYGYYIKDANNEMNIYRSHRASTGVIQHLLHSLERDLKVIEEVYALYLPRISLTNEQKSCYEQSDMCHICGVAGFDNSKEKKKVADHSERTGIYRGSAHADCQNNYHNPKFVPIFFHNLSGYDAKFIVKELGFTEGHINVIPESTEKFISFSKKVGKLELRFLDSCRFMSSSLAKLANNLPKEHFQNVRSYCKDEAEFQLMTQKGIYPYDYLTSYAKFEETSLPPKKEFYSRINESPITEEDYGFAQKVWDVMNVKDLGHYTDIYLKADVLILADVFENFRDICLETYGLDPAWYFSAPGLSWSAMLKSTKAELQLITEYDMLLMLEQGKRGGLCQCVKRFAKANNKFLATFDVTKESTYINYLDANNLYGWAMSQALPTGNFKWIQPEQLHQFDVTAIPDDVAEGYILDVDITYPQHLHGAHKDLPYCPIAQEIPGTKHSKLLTTVENKQRYVAHYTLLKQAVEAGLIITKIHRGIKFTQSAWLRPYVDLNTQKRKLAKNEFEKDFFKLMVNSVFGKTLENIRNRIQLELVTDHKKFEKLVAKPNFIDRTVLKNDGKDSYMIAMHMGITKLVFNKPIYVGLSVLDISKTKMYDFHYNIMKPHYKDRLNLLYMDTDSFFYETKTEDWYRDMQQFLPLLDTSDYPFDHPLHSKTNKKALGKFKDELNGKVIQEFVGLRAKMYAFSTSETEVKKAKGIKRRMVEKELDFNNYKDVLFDNLEMMSSFNNMRSFHQTMYSVRTNKKSLSPHDDKRIVLEDNIHTVPYGYNNGEPPSKRRRLM